MSATTPVFPIVPTTQQYDWGKRGLESKVAQLACKAKTPGFQFDEGKPYAELWMGTHVSSPSKLLSGVSLAQHLAEHPSLIGDDTITTFDASDGNIPFLFKILAINTALSIQTHPDKQTAEKLHAEQPNVYKDPNHKPEMAIALTPFLALCGFRPLSQIAAFLNSTPELGALITSTTLSQFNSVSTSRNPEGEREKSALRELFREIMTAPEDKFKSELAKLVSRYKSESDLKSEGGMGGKVNAKAEEEEVKELVIRLESQYPGDIGVFCAFVLNVVKMQPGEAIFLGAGEPHAYISGDAVEVMATSDNVIRAGLTPKLRDVPNLLSGLTYSASPASKHTVKTQPFHPASSYEPSQDSFEGGAGQETEDPFADPVAEKTESVLYDPPVPEFSVVRVHVVPWSENESDEEEIHAPLRGPSIFIVTSGSGRVLWSEPRSSAEGPKWTNELELVEGRVVFVGAGTSVKFAAGEKESLELYRAFVEPRV